MDLNTVWFVLFGVLITGYAILDGFDLGVGVLALFARDDRERRIHLNAVGPVWDGNEVWLLTGGGALFAAFPKVYATVFSGFYLALILLLMALIFRAVSFEFRGKVESPGWKKAWDLAFGLGSLVPALLYGVAVGNVMRGIPMDAATNYTGGFLDLLNPFALLVGVLSLVMFTAHGAAWMALKTRGALQERMIRTRRLAWIAWIVLFILATVATAAGPQGLVAAGLGRPVVWLALLVFVAGHALVAASGGPDRAGRAFLGSSLAIAGQVFTLGLSMYPTLVPALGEGTALTITNAASTHRTLMTMLVIALIGMPLVIAYTVLIYRVFRGEVVLDEHSY